MFNSLYKQKKSNNLNVFLETAYAEYASALEMLAACKISNKDSGP